MRKNIAGISLGFLLTLATPSFAEELSLAYFMGPNHPMNAAVFTPFEERLAELSGGALTVDQFPGGALNGVPPRQYSILLDGVADIVFALPGYTGDVFPVTNIVTYPGVCHSASECTGALLNARSTIEKEYNAKLLAIWANDPPILITRDHPVRTLEDLEGLIIRVTSHQDVAFVDALGASGVTQPVNVVNQNLANGVIDGITIAASGIRSFNLHEAGRYLTTWFPGSGSAFVLLMNQDVYNALSEEEKSWVDQAADESLSVSGGAGFEAASRGGMALAEESGMEIIEISTQERARWMSVIQPTLDDVHAAEAGPYTVEEIIALMNGE